MKALAAEGMLDDKQAADLVAKAEKVRVGEIVQPRRQKALDDALAHEVKEALAVLAELDAALAPLKAEAEQAADRLTAAVVDPLAADLRGDTGRAFDRDTGRTILERYSRGVFRAAELSDRIKTASVTTWGAGHIPQAAAEIVEGFDHELAAIRKGTASLKAALRALEKSFG